MSGPVTRWEGGDSPCLPWDYVMVLQRNGEKLLGYSSDFRWYHYGPFDVAGFDIIYYKIL